MKVRIFAPAKANLHLAVGGKRDDGYHDVTTVLQALELGDTVVIEPDNTFGFACTPDLGLRADDNLACRAAMAMAEQFTKPLDVRIHVEKSIPAGAGLGGASADAAATIVGLAHHWGIAEGDPALREVARSLGADVPFFLEGGAALFTGRGDVLQRRVRPLDAPIVLIKPAEPVATAEAYAAFDRLGGSAEPDVVPLTEALERRDAAGVAARLFNNMTEPSVGLVPGIGAALRVLAESPGILGAIMAGSGSAAFGICSSKEAAQRCAQSASEAGFWSVVTHSRASGCQVS